MGVDRSRAILRGLLVPPKHRALWDDESGEYSATGTRLHVLEGATPIPGVPVAGQTTDLALQAHGSPSASLTVQTTRGGLPGQDEAGVIVAESDTPTEWYGGDLPTVLSGWHVLRGTGTHYEPHVCAWADGVAVAWETSTDIVVQVYDADADAWNATVTVATAGGTSRAWPCLMRLPSGRLHLYHWVPDGSDWQVRLHYSDDDGATWTNAGNVLLDSVSGVDHPSIHRLRAAYMSGQTLLVAHVGDNSTYEKPVIMQWATADGGQQFSLVEAWDAAAPRTLGAWPDLVAVGDTFYFAWLGDPVGATTAVQTVSIAEITGAWEKLSEAEYVQPTSGLADACYLLDATNTYPWTKGELALWASDDGAIYLSVRDVSVGDCIVLRYADGEIHGMGESNRHSVPPALCWYDEDTAEQKPYGLAAAECRGRCFMAHGGEIAKSPNRHLYVSQLGGLSRVTHPHAGGSLSPSRRTGWSRTWAAWHLPDEGSVGWWTHTGGGTSAIVSDRLTLAAGDYYDAAPGGALTGVISEFGIEVIAGGDIEINSLIGDGSTTYWLSVAITQTTISVYDENAAVLLTTLNQLSASVRIRIAMSQSDAVVWVLTDTSGTPEAQHWIEVWRGTLTSASATTASLLRVSAPSGNTASPYWDWAAQTNGATGTGDHLVATPTVTSLYPRPIRTEPAWLLDGVSVSALTGPTVTGDTWTIAQDWEYPPSALDPSSSPSPSAPWHSRALADMDSTTDHLRLSWRIEESGSDEQTESPLYGLWLEGCTITPGSTVWLYYGGVWNQVATLDGVAVSMFATGQTAIVDITGTSASETWRRGELVGGHLEAPAVPTVARIERNRPGVSVASTGSLRMQLAVDRAIGTGAQVCTIWPRRYLVLLDLSAWSETIRGVQLRVPIPTTAPPEGYFEIGQLALGPVWAWGWSYSWGRRLTTEAPTEIYTARDGSISVEALGPAYDTVELSWEEGVPTWDVEQTSEPDYVAAVASGPPLAFRRDAPLDALDALRVLQGSATPVVYLPHISRADLSGGAAVYRSRWADGALYGVITGAVSVDSVRGDEQTSEQLRVQRITVRGMP